MKLLSRDDAGVVFLIGKRERQMMFSVLERYPLLSTSHQRATRGGTASPETDELLREALAEQQAKNKAELRQMLADPGRFAENELGFQFKLKPEEIDWLLQAFNDVRVGSWVRLGSPAAGDHAPPSLTEENVQLVWALEIAGLFESALLEALSSAP